MMQNPNELTNWYQTFTPDEEQRKSWYSSVAETYDRVRPKYPQELLDRAVQLAGIPKNGDVLEIGCGPGTATIGLAQMGFRLVFSLEPSLEACTLASQNCHEYSNVTVVNANFEEWPPGICRFNAVVAATSWHWVAPKYKYLKAASVLKDGGSLILIWNTGMKPPIEIFKSLTELFKEYIPTFAQYKSNESELTEMRIFANEAINSGLFSNLREESQLIEVNYPIDDYLQLLTTYSPCIALSPQRRQELLEKMRSILERICDKKIPLSYQSVLHITSLVKPVGWANTIPTI
jgi:ubiquinone/menaquinone biosynthesis C-methylase UbiE